MNTEQLRTIWPEWNVVEQIGKGSFGEVYKVMREGHGFTDYAAVKVITIPQNASELNSLRADGHDEISARSYFEGIVTDFVNEIKLMVSMKGAANIVSVEDYKVVEKTGEIGWDIYIRMELLTSFIDYSTGKKLSQDEVIKLGQDICSALELCSRSKIIHGDIKPENIFVSSLGEFKLGDIGISRVLEKNIPTAMKGVFNYRAPEVVKGEAYDATIDVYSLGLVLYKLLNNNRLPFIAPHTEQIMYQDRKDAVYRRLNGEQLPAPIDANPELGHVIMKACMYNPSLRFRSATEFKQALELIKNGKYEILPFTDVEFYNPKIVCITCGDLFKPGVTFCSVCGTHFNKNKEVHGQYVKCVGKAGQQCPNCNGKHIGNIKYGLRYRSVLFPIEVFINLFKRLI